MAEIKVLEQHDCNNKNTENVHKKKCSAPHHNIICVQICDWNMAFTKWGELACIFNKKKNLCWNCRLNSIHKLDVIINQI